MGESSPEGTGCEIIQLQIEHSSRATISATLSHILTSLPLAMDLPSAQEVLNHLVGIEQELLRERQEKKDLETRLNALPPTTTGLMAGLPSCIRVPLKQIAE